MKKQLEDNAAALHGTLARCCSGCSRLSATEKEPIELTVWTYYNGDQLRAFNEAVDAFNATEGKENSITRDALRASARSTIWNRT